jgi:hypothetical protein
MKTLIKITIFLLLIFLQKDLYSQIPDSKCAADDTSPITFGIPYKSPTQGDWLLPARI